MMILCFELLEVYMKKIAFAGSFDPITNGHLWVIEEGLQIADKLLLFIAYNPNKKAKFSIEEKEEIIDKALKERGIRQLVEVIVLKNEYAAYSALQAGCDYSIRGIRNAADFDYESLIQQTNRDVLMGTKTLFVMPPKDLESVSSSFVKNLVGPPGWHWHIKRLLPTSAYNVWLRQYIKEMVFNYMGLQCNEETKLDFVKDIIEHYSDKNRFYHNVDHIVHCFQELEWAILNGSIKKEIYEDVALAIATHDIIYGMNDPIMSDEELSAQWLEKFLSKINENRLEAVNLVRSTEHLSGKYELNTEKEKLLNSIDLAILAQNEKIYQLYTENVRKEYSFVDESLFNQGRLNALTILSKKNLYPHQAFKHYEKRALKNLDKEIEKLKLLIKE